MNILLDECVPRPLARYLEGYQVQTVPQAGWASTVNGPLIRLAESEFDVFITVDKRIRYQQSKPCSFPQSSFCRSSFQYGRDKLVCSTRAVQGHSEHCEVITAAP
jgi:hypothetical protein